MLLFSVKMNLPAEVQSAGNLCVFGLPDFTTRACIPLCGAALKHRGHGGRLFFSLVKVRIDQILQKPFIPSFHYSIIPGLRQMGMSQKIPVFSKSCRNSKKLNKKVRAMNQKLFGLLQPKMVLPILMIVAFMLAFLSPALAAEEKPAESAWEFHVAHYLWVIAMNGNVTVKGFEADVNMSFSDI